MKRPITFLMASALAVVVAFNIAGAAEAKKKKGKAAPEVPPDPMTRFDRNANGVLEKPEREALRAAFAKEAALKILDLNSDGKLDDSELNAVEVPPKAKGGGKKKKTE